jgi:predicted nucleic acid-binding protein
VGSLTRTIKRGDRIVVDTAPLIYLLEDLGERGAIMGAVFDRVLDGGTVLVPAVAVAELYVKPLRDQLDVVVRSIDAFLSSPGVEVVALDQATARRGAEVRAFVNIAMPDALIAAHALEADATLVTNDRRLERVAGLKVAVVDNLG